MSRCGIVILAAGGSSRMGRPKQLLDVGGTSLLRRAADTALASLGRPVIAVLGANASEASTKLSGLPVTVVINDRWASGMGTSIRAGVCEIDSAIVDAVMILLCDQPLISASAINGMISSHFQAGRKMTAALYAGTLGTPAIFSASLFPELIGLGDQQGGKTILQRHSHEVNALPLEEAKTDLDTPEDYSNFQDRLLD